MRTFGRYLVTCTSGQELTDLFPVLPWTNIKVKSILNPWQDGSVSQFMGLLSESNIMNANWLSNSKLVIEWLEKWLNSRGLQFNSQHPHQDVFALCRHCTQVHKPKLKAHTYIYLKFRERCVGARVSKNYLGEALAQCKALPKTNSSYTDEFQDGDVFFLHLNCSTSHSWTESSITGSSPVSRLLHGP